MYTLFSGLFTIVLGSSSLERDAATDQDRVSTYFDMPRLVDWTDHSSTRGLPKYFLARPHRRYSSRGTWARFWRCHQLASLAAQYMASLRSTAPYCGKIHLLQSARIRANIFNTRIFTCPQVLRDLPALRGERATAGTCPACVEAPSSCRMQVSVLLESRSLVCSALTQMQVLSPERCDSTIPIPRADNDQSPAATKRCSPQIVQCRWV